MECSICGSFSAKLHTRTVDGTKKEMCLCQACYQKLYSKSDAPDIFSRLYGGNNAEAKDLEVCPSCGVTREAFKRSSLLGCSGCYSAFRNTIYNSVRYCQRGRLHVGKAPSGSAEQKYDLVRDQEAFRSQINAARRAGNYQLADELELRLREVRAKLARTEEDS